MAIEQGMGRRAFVRIGAAGVATLVCGRLFAPRGALADTPAGGAAAAKACIVLWLNGGPSHIDTFDPKPGTKAGGPFKAIKTSAPGVMIGEHLPQFAAEAHRLAILRGMSSKEGSHQRAQYLLHTGYAPNPTVDHPALGGYVSQQLGDPAAELPAFVSLGGPSAGGGFLGVQHGPLIVQTPGAMPRDVGLAVNVDEARFGRREAALAILEEELAARTGDPKVHGRRAVHDKAVRMMRSPRLAAFDVSSEPEQVRKAYGDTAFGRGCLTARRLIEAGVRYVEVVLDGWDTHRDGFERTKRLMGALDPAVATLLRELEARKLLDATLVACLGEFGRTPRINGDEGRDHHPQAWSAVLAGGGIRGGVVHGKTDAEGGKVVEGATSVADLFATIAARIGLDPTKTFDTPLGRPISLTEDGTPIAAVMKTG